MQVEKQFTKVGGGITELGCRAKWKNDIVNHTYVKGTRYYWECTKREYNMSQRYTQETLTPVL